MRLNLGSCDRQFPGFLSVDIAPPADIICDLSQRWPWPDSSIEEVRSHDCFEHLPDRIRTMNSLYRVLVPGGRATVEVPSAAHGAGFACDPTHVSAWCLSSFEYFEDGAPCWLRFHEAYGITARFRVLSLVETPDPSHKEPVWKVTAILEAVK
jgi:SAM-dependent methyltransferase